MARGILFVSLGSLIVLGGCAPQSSVDTVTLEQQLVSILELHTYEHLYRDIVYFGEEKSFLFVRTVDREVLFSVNIKVRAGVDLAEGFRVVQDRDVADRVYVQLPPAQVLSVDADEQSIHEYFIREQGGRIGLLEITGQLEEVKERTAADAIERGILVRADANARRVVTEFLKLTGFADVVFTTPPQLDESELRG